MNVNFNGYHDLGVIDCLKKDRLPVVIYGGGDLGRKVHSKLMENNIFNLLHVDDGASFFSPSKVDTIFEEYNVVAGFGGVYLDLKKFNVFKNRKRLLYFGDLMPVERITEEYYNEQKNRFDEVYESLKDQKSKDSLELFLKCRINGDAAFGSKLVEKPQYFSGDFMKIFEEETFVDCGAYIGDTIRDFLAITEGKYKSIYAFEPDVENFRRLKEMTDGLGLHDVNLVMAGSNDKTTKLRFSGGAGMYSQIDDNGGVAIDTDTIDNIVGNDDCTLIAMDVEGAEMPSLKGAKETISRCRPKLAISVYHKRDDIFVIYDYLKSIHDDYKFYFRMHKALPIDAVLYAI